MSIKHCLLSPSSDFGTGTTSGKKKTRKKSKLIFFHVQSIFADQFLLENPWSPAEKWRRGNIAISLQIDSRLHQTRLVHVLVRALTYADNTTELTSGGKMCGACINGGRGRGLRRASPGVRRVFIREPLSSNLNANEFKRATRISLGDGDKPRCFRGFCAARVVVMTHNLRR